ncbi:MAG: SIMPL domain-containing protein [Candidatus Pacebacteria bacterium]|nr:SIMPL domain-containing protein [Candidatus Paceibacterota bacterium]
MDTFNDLTGSKAFRFAVIAAVGLLALFLLVKTVDGLYSIGNSEMYPARTITVEGTGEATAIPDIAQISFTVMERGATVAEAQDKATNRIDTALASVKDMDIEEEDVKTTYYSVTPTYEYPQPCYSGICPPVASSPRITGYEVSQGVEVKVRDTAKAGEVLQGLGSAGVQNISGPNFVLDDADSVREEARDAAIEDAKAKAKKLASELGVSLGKVVSFSENTGYYPYDYGYGGKAEMAMDAGVSSRPVPSLPVGENETSITVMVTYEIR